MSKICVKCNKIFSSIVNEKIGRIELTEKELEQDPIEPKEFGESDFICPVCEIHEKYVIAQNKLKTIIDKLKHIPHHTKLDMISVYDTEIKICYYTDKYTRVEQIIPI